MVLRKVPIADSVDGMAEPPPPILLGPPEQDALAISFNQHVIEPADEASNHEPEPNPPAAREARAPCVEPQRAPLAGLPSRRERCARQVAYLEVMAAQRNALLRDSYDFDSSDPFAELSVYADVKCSES